MEHMGSNRKQVCICLICDERFEYNCQLSKHVGTHKECPYCNDTFADYNNLKKHMGFFRKQVYKCLICDERFDYQCQLSKHIEKHKKCLYCDEIFLDHNTLMNHLETHKECSYCKQRFQNHNSLVKHQSQFSQSKRAKYACLICGELFEYQCQLSKHLQRKQVHKCLICDERFEYNCQLSKHVGTHKECPYCNETFADPNSLLTHVRSTRKGVNKNYICLICDEHFEYNCQLSKHVGTHKDCPYCNKIFAETDSLRKHVRPTRKQVSKDYKCLICDEHFQYNCQLSKHEVTHKECPYCNELFADSNTLMKHLHSLRKPSKHYKCMVCDEHFENKCHLSKHLLTHKERVFKVQSGREPTRKVHV